MMTRSRELYHRVSYSRRREICGFIHEFKKLMGRKYHMHVVEMLEDCDEDYIFADGFKGDAHWEDVTADVLALTDKYGIPRRNVSTEDWNPITYEDEKVIEISLYSDF